MNAPTASAESVHQSKWMDYAIRIGLAVADRRSRTAPGRQTYETGDLAGEASGLSA